MDELLSILQREFVSMRYSFQEIALKRTKRWRDADGKKRQKTKTFSQTLNPFNRNKDGTLKTVPQIMKELDDESKVWMNKKEPT